MTRSRMTGALALAAYLWAAIGLPVVHHALHDHAAPDHHHGYARGNDGHGHGHGHGHGQGSDGAHEILESLLGDAAHAAAAVDCSIADYTLVDCATAPAGGHALTFADLSRPSPRPEPAPPFDPTHGRGALEHMQASLLGAAPVLLPPPAAAFVASPPSAPVLPPRAAPPVRHPGRGPPVEPGVVS